MHSKGNVRRSGFGPFQCYRARQELVISRDALVDQLLTDTVLFQDLELGSKFLVASSVLLTRA